MAELKSDFKPTSRFDLDVFDFNSDTKEQIFKEIARLKSNWKKRDSDCNEAVEAGFKLLEEQTSLKEELSDLLQKIEALKQENHELKIKCTTKLSYSDLNQTQVENLQEQLGQREKENAKHIVALKDLNSQIKTLFRERDDLEAKLEDKTGEINQQKELIIKLQKELNAREIVINSAISCNDQSLGSSKLNEGDDILTLKEQNAKIIHLNVKLEEDKHRVIESLTSELNSLKDELLRNDKNFSTVLKEKHSEIEELKEEIEMLKLQPFNDKQRGNCLFAEVEDHRKILEEKLEKKETQIENLTSKLNKAYQEISKQKFQIDTLLKMKNQNLRLTELEQNLTMARTQNKDLSYRLEEEKKKNRDAQTPQSIFASPKFDDCSKGVPSLSYSILEVRLKRTIEDLQEKDQELDRLQFKYQTVDDKVIRLQNELFNSKQQVESLENNMYNLHSQLNAMRNKKSLSESSTERPRKTSVIIETIPLNLNKENIFLPEDNESVFLSPKESQDLATMTLDDLRGNVLLEDAGNTPQQEVPVKKVSWSSSTDFKEEGKKVEKRRIKMPVPKESTVEPVCKQQ